jgi:two-component system response regulator
MVFPKPILLAEDDANDVFILRRYYNKCGVHNPLHVVSDGEAVVKYFEKNRLNYPLPVLLMLDLSMPPMGGLEVLRHLKKSGLTGFYTVDLTGRIDPQMVNEAHELGAHEYLVKEVEKEGFCGLMARVPGIQMAGCDPNENPKDARVARLPLASPGINPRNPGTQARLMIRGSLDVFPLSKGKFPVLRHWRHQNFCED